MDIDLDRVQKAARRATVLMKALSNEKRLMILCQLSESAKSVGQLAKLVGLAQSPLSQHLAKQREDGLVKTRREAQTIYDSLVGDTAHRVIRLLYDICYAPSPGKG